VGGRAIGRPRLPTLRLTNSSRVAMKRGGHCDPGTHRPDRDRPGRWDPAGWRRHGLSGGPEGPIA